MRYSGLAKDFGWVLPLPKVPKVGVGSKVLFDALDTRMAMRYAMAYAPAENCRGTWQGCKDYPMVGGGDFADASASGADVAGSDTSKNGGGPGVEILASGTTGPYDYTVVQGGNADVLYTWLNTRGYATPDKAKPILQSHITKGDVFVAVKLSNGQGVEAIRPITLEMADTEACVPLRLTSIAAADDLAVVVTIAGPGRAIVKNHLDVEPNPLRMALLNDQGTPNYNGTYIPCNQDGQYYYSCQIPTNLAQVQSAAIDEAGGHAFVTEAAFKGSDLGNLLNMSKNSADWLAKVKNLDDVANQLAVASDFPVNSEVGDALSLPLALTTTFPGVDPAQALADLRACGQYWQMPQSPECQLPGGLVLTHEQLQAVAIDGVGAQTAMKVGIIDPLFLVGDQLAAAPMLTRLSMRISPSEMDRDPVFSFNSSLPKVDPTRVILSNQVCLDGWDTGPQATRLSIDGLGSWLFTGSNTLDPRFVNAPTALWVRLQDETGPAIDIATAQISLIDTAIKGALPGKASLPVDLNVQKGKPWQAPASDLIATKQGPWHSPGSWCEPRAGWVDGKPAPSETDLDAGSTDVAGDTQDTNSTGTVPGIDAAGGWTDVHSPQATAATGVAASDNSGCTAGRTHRSQSLGLLMISGLLAAVVLRRRQRKEA